MILLPCAQLIYNDLSASSLFSIIHPTHSHSRAQDSGLPSSRQLLSWRAVLLQNLAPFLSTLRSISGPGSEQIRVMVSFSSLGIISNVTSSLLLFNKNEFFYFSLCKSSSFFKGWFKYCFPPGIFANCSSLFSESLFYWCLSSNLNSDRNHVSCIIYSYYKWIKIVHIIYMYIYFFFTSIYSMMPHI